MTLIRRISKKIIFSSLIFINFIQPSKSVEFQKINNTTDDQVTRVNWSKKSNKQVLPNPSDLLLKNKFEKISVENKLLERYSDPKIADISEKQKELIIQSDKQSEINDVLFAEGNVSI